MPSPRRRRRTRREPWVNKSTLPFRFRSSIPDHCVINLTKFQKATVGFLGRIRLYQRPKLCAKLTNMSNSLLKPAIVLAKLAAIGGFLALIYGTYALRSEVLVLSEIRFSADDVRARNNLEQLEESFPTRVVEYETNLKQYELQKEHYNEMLDLYETNYDEYVKRIEDKYQLPALPRAPKKPQPPEVAKELYEINAAFRLEKHRYFADAISLNRIATVAAMTLVGSLIFLMMFDTESPRWHYIAALMISFVFLIGPAFQSILTGIIGVMAEPSLR